MDIILFATLSGGVAIGTCAEFLTEAWIPFLIGIVAGIASTSGYKFHKNHFEGCAKNHDTCGVHYVFGIPGIIGGLASAIAISFIADLYKTSSLLQIEETFPRMAE